MQVPDYPEPAKLAEVEKQLASFPPLVFAGEARDLKAKLAKVAAGESFLLQGGDCAESFEEHAADNIRDFFRVFLQMAVVMTFAAASPVVKVGRVAGQFAKPRSSPTEKRDDVELPSYRGDIINGNAISRAEARRPDPRRQLMAYRQSAATLEFLARVCSTGGYANLAHAHRWMLGFVKDSPQSKRYQDLADRLTEALEFMRACGIDAGVTRRVADHRFLHQPRGAAARLRAGDDARRFHAPATWYSTSGHMLWIGDRTRQRIMRMSNTAAASRTRSASSADRRVAPDGLLKLIDILNPGQ